jgi:hypothetical protein
MVETMKTTARRLKASSVMAKKSDRISLAPRTADEVRKHEFILRHDFVGLDFYRAEKLRRKRKLTQWERDFLREFDSIRRRIAHDPRKVKKQAFDAVFRGLRLLEYLIHEKWRNDLPKKTNPDYLPEMADADLYDALITLMEVTGSVRDDFINYAEMGSPFACVVIFEEAKKLASAFSRLAIAHPENFQRVALRSLTMPSLRARNPAFTCDAEAIIKAIRLAEGHHASNIHDNRSRIGALCHQYMAEIVDLLEAARLEIKQHGDAKHHLAQLPELRGNAQLWWTAEIKDWVHREFVRMKKNHYRNPALWQELEKITDHGTDSAMCAAFEKYCRNKLDQIAGKVSAPA